MAFPQDRHNGTRGFTLDLPEDVIELPVDIDIIDSDSIANLASDIARSFGLSQHDDGAVSLAAHLAAVGTSSGEHGVDYVAVGMYRSPNDPDRMLMVLLTATSMESAHDDVEIAISGLMGIHDAVENTTVSILDLPAGRAVAVVSEQRNGITLQGVSVPILQRQVTVWVPDDSGTTVAAISVSTNNWQDWEHVCRLALLIVDSFSWERVGQPTPTGGRGVSHQA